MLSPRWAGVTTSDFRRGSHGWKRAVPGTAKVAGVAAGVK
jgi:hypothetical protein